MTDDDRALCPNCESSLHAACCCWCGKQSAKPYARGLLCSAACAKEAERADRISAAIERNEQTPRLTAAVRRGLGDIRSLARVTADNGIDMTDQEIAGMNLAIQWLDHQMTSKKSSSR